MERMKGKRNEKLKGNNHFRWMASQCNIRTARSSSLCSHQSSSGLARASSTLTYFPLQLIYPRVFSQLVVRIPPRSPSGFLAILRVPEPRLGSGTPLPSAAVTGKSKETGSDCLGDGLQIAKQILGPGCPSPE